MSVYLANRREQDCKICPFKRFLRRSECRRSSLKALSLAVYTLRLQRRKIVRSEEIYIRILTLVINRCLRDVYHVEYLAVFGVVYSQQPLQVRCTTRRDVLMVYTGENVLGTVFLDRPRSPVVALLAVDRCERKNRSKEK